MDSATRSHARLPWPALALLFLLPVLLGLAFQTHGSGNGDSPAYRNGVCIIETEGRIPLARLEWSHPAHIATSWGLTRLLSALGLADDPHYAIHLLNFLILGLLSLVLARTWWLYDPDPGRSFLAGLTLAILPGWAWCAQEPLSDVSGHGLVALGICALLALQVRIRRHQHFLLTGLLAAFLAGLAFLFRPGAGLFFPLILWLGVEALRSCRSRRRSLLTAFLCGGLLPIVVVYLHLIAEHGFAEFLALHFPESIHNTGGRTLAIAIGLAEDWIHHSHRGLGTYAFLLSCTGWAVWVLAGDWRIRGPEYAKPQVSWSSLRPIFLFALGLLPYYLFLLGNDAAERFRFALPIQMALVLGLVPLLGHLQRLRPAPWLLPFIGLFVVATLFHSLPLLHIFSTRDHFIERGAREISKIAKHNDLLIGHQLAPFLRLRETYGNLLAGGWGQGLAARQGARVIGIRFSPSERERDFWNLDWRSAEREILATLDRGERVLLANELALRGFRKWMSKRGFEEDTLSRFAAETLRHRFDSSLERMSRLDARRLVDLEILQLRGPTARLRIETAEGKSQLFGTATWHAGQPYRLLAGTYSEKKTTPLLGMDLPLSAEPRQIASGKLDERGELGIGVDSGSLTRGEVLLLIVLNATNEKAVARSPLVFPHATDDRSPPDLELWVPSKAERQLR